MDALTDLPLINPDIVIVDLLMPEIDGITFVKRARSYAPDLTFIMLSQVASKDMIADAYSAGIEFYIHKPINSIEVESILRKVSESLTAAGHCSRCRRFSRPSRILYSHRDL